MAASLHGSPDPTDLVQTVRDLLADEVLDAVDGRTRFHVRVAMNVLDIVGRQLAAAPDDENAHQERLLALGFADDAELAEAIRSGAMDGRYDELARLLREDLWAKVAVVNPGYRLPYDSPYGGRETIHW
jgi:uncharacterized protein DUF6285